MINQSPDQDEKRLKDLYAEKSDTELELLAEDPDSLTECARRVLAEELERRSLNPVQPPPAELVEPIHPELVTIRRYGSLFEAQFAKTLLDAAGIECFLADQEIMRINWFIGPAVGGIRLQVRDNDVQAAEEVLETETPTPLEDNPEADKN